MKNINLSASNADRWTRCHASCQRFYASSTSVEVADAAAGTFAHRVAEAELKSIFEDDKFAFAELHRNKMYNSKVKKCVSQYVEYVLNVYKKTEDFEKIELEKEIDVKLTNSTAIIDCLITSKKVMHIIDFKFGSGVRVSANSEQFTIYALAAYYNTMHSKDVEKVVVHVVQPSLRNFRRKEFSLEDLENEKIRLCNIVLDIFEEAGKGNFQSEAGLHCRFCKRAGFCNSFIKTLNETKEKSIINLSDAEISRLLQNRLAIEKFFEKLEIEALRRLKKGREIEGFTVSAVQRRHYKENTEEAVADALRKAGKSEEEIFTKKLKSITTLQNELTEEEFEGIEQFIETIQTTEKLKEDK